MSKYSPVPTLYAMECELKTLRNLVSVELITQEQFLDLQYSHAKSKIHKHRSPFWAFWNSLLWDQINLALSTSSFQRHNRRDAIAFIAYEGNEERTFNWLCEVTGRDPDIWRKAILKQVKKQKTGRGDVYRETRELAA